MASRSGYMMRVDQARAAAAAKLCSCGHAVGDHLNLPYETYEINGLEVTITKNPAYKISEFHCRHDGCDCVIDTDQKETT